MRITSAINVTKTGMRAVLMWLAIGSVSQATESPPIRVTPEDVNLHPKRYINSVVSVSGYIVLGERGKMGGHVIMQSESIYNREKVIYSSGRSFDSKLMLKYCLNISNPDALYDGASRYNKKHLVIIGTIVDNYDDPTSCSGGLALSMKRVLPH